jgi:hypothetical protein
MSPFFQRLDRISEETHELLRSKARKPLTYPQSKRAEELLQSALKAQDDAAKPLEKEHAADVVADVRRLLS